LKKKIPLIVDSDDNTYLTTTLGGSVFNLLSSFPSFLGVCLFRGSNLTGGDTGGFYIE